MGSTDVTTETCCTASHCGPVAGNACGAWMIWNIQRGMLATWRTGMVSVGRKFIGSRPQRLAMPAQTRFERGMRTFNRGQQGDARVRQAKERQQPRRESHQGQRQSQQHDYATLAIQPADHAPMASDHLQGFGVMDVRPVCVRAHACSPSLAAISACRCAIRAMSPSATSRSIATPSGVAHEILTPIASRVW